MIRIASGVFLLSLWGLVLWATLTTTEDTVSYRMSTAATITFLFGAPGAWLLYDGVAARQRRRRVLELAMLDYRDYQEIDTLLIAQQVKINPVITRQIINQGIAQGLIPHDTKIK